MAKGPVIRHPKTPPGSYQGCRDLKRNCLLHSQVKHFVEVEMGLPEEHRSGMRPEEIDTEEKAANFIRHLTLKLHELRGKA